MERMRMQMRWPATVLASALLVPAAVLACPTCNDAISGDPVAAAFSVTTLALIAMPFLLIGTIGSWVTYVYWRAGRRESAANAASSTDAAWQPLWTGEESQP